MKIEDNHYKELDYYADVYRTDKGSKYHGYTKSYAQHLGPYRTEVRRLLELGLGDINSLNREGESLYMWEAFFPYASIEGIDNDPKKLYPENSDNRIYTYCRDQTDDLSDLGMYDVIIDDASHIKENTLISFQNLFYQVNPGGFYIIEDVVAPAFWPGWGGSGTCMKSPFLDFFFDLARHVNLQKIHNFPDNVEDRDNYNFYYRNYFTKEIEYIAFHQGMIIIKKY